MPDKKLTDNEIVKALKTLLELVLVEGCLQRAKTISLALDLINRLQAENMVLKDDLDYFKKINAERNISALKGTIQTAKAEAYKEFAERLHEELRMYGIKDKFNKSVFLNVVDKAKKELVGEEK